jgi:hypothetical protein
MHRKNVASDEFDKSSEPERNPMKVFRTFAIALLSSLVCVGIASSQEATSSPKWQKLTNAATFNADTPLLLTDGTVMVHQYQSTSWWRLTPSITGSYVNGTWTTLAPAPSGYKPLYFASAVLADGNVVVEGGEYDGTQSETNSGAIYNPVPIPGLRLRLHPVGPTLAMHKAWSCPTEPSCWETAVMPVPNAARSRCSKLCSMRPH